MGSFERRCPQRTSESPTSDAHKRGAVSKGMSPMCFTESPIVTLSRDAQFRNALSPMCVIESQKVILAKEKQQEKASSPMCVTDCPRVTETRFAQFWKQTQKCLSNWEGCSSERAPVSSNQLWFQLPLRSFVDYCCSFTFQQACFAQLLSIIHFHHWTVLKQFNSQNFALNGIFGFVLKEHSLEFPDSGDQVNIVGDDITI